MQPMTSFACIMVGDFNARTGHLDDFISVEDTVATECGLDLIICI